MEPVRVQIGLGDCDGIPLTYKVNSAVHSVPDVFALPWAAWTVHGPALAPRAALAR